MESYLSEIRIFGCQFAPRQWAYCNGAVMPINANHALYALVGIVFGGDGTTNFKLPDLRGRVPCHRGQYIAMGEAAGEEVHTLTAMEMPAHIHMGIAANTSDSATAAPAGQMLGQAPKDLYTDATPNVAMNAGAIGTMGGSQAHENRQPSLAVNFCIATQGIFPSRN